MSEKYPDGYVYGSIAMVGKSISAFFWPLIAMRIINPLNKSMIVEKIIGDELLLFDKNIANNVPFFL